MNWLRNLLRRPAPTRSAQLPAARSAAATAPARAADIGALREALAAAPVEEHSRCESDLGRALAAARESPLADDAPGVWLAAVCHVSDKAMALAWAEKVAGDRPLAELAPALVHPLTGRTMSAHWQAFDAGRQPLEAADLDL